MKTLFVLTFAAVACANPQQPPPTKLDATSNSASAPTAASSPSGGGASSVTFRATLSPDEEVPRPVLDSGARPSGTATLTLNGSTLSYQVSATGLSSPYTGAHLHAGPAGVAGPVIAPLQLTAGEQGTASGQGTIDASSIKGKNPDGSPMTMEGLIAALQRGDTYVNVHTAKNKPGEARGQLRP